MSVCRGIGNGIGGALGKWGAGLGSALGLGAAVDLGVRAYTGYGLLDTLNVPYIECPDGSYASAIEWYGGGMKCQKKPETTKLKSPSGASRNAAIGKYISQIEGMGGSVYPYLGRSAVGPWIEDGTVDAPAYWNANAVSISEHYNAQSRAPDKAGNIVKAGVLTWGSGTGDVRGDDLHAGIASRNFGWGGWGSMSAPAGFNYKDIRQNEDLNNKYSAYLGGGYGIIGIRIEIPNNFSLAPPAGPQNYSTPGGQPLPRREKEDCEEMSCPCITLADIEKAIKKALGLNPFSPESLVRGLGAKIYAAPGPSAIPIVPATLVEAIAAIVATVYMRAGYGRYPVMMPSSLINDDGVGDAVPSQPIENYAEWFEWHIKQQDAIQGEWPIDIAIVDGAKRQPLKFENISEALAELSGLVIQTATDADGAVSVAAHAAVAATKAHTASVIAQKNVECLIKFFGVRTGFGSIFIDSAITPMDSDNPTFNLRKFLTSSKQLVAFYTDNDPFDFQAVLDRILRNSEISKSAVAMDAKTGLVGDYARNQRKYDAAEAKKEAEKELDKLQATINANNPEFKVKIRVDTPAPSGDLLGNNFVIKRPKSTDE